MLTRVRAGFTLLEIVVATAIVAILGAAVFMTLSGSQNSTRVQDSYVILNTLAGRLHRYDSLTGNSATAGARLPLAGKYPQMLSHLVYPIAEAVNASGNCLDCHTSCGFQQTLAAGVTFGYSATNNTAWDLNGPYYDRNIVVSIGFPIPIGFLRDSLVRTPAQTTATAAAAQAEAGTLQIQIDSVLEDDANELKRVVDGQVTDATVGTIRWTGSVVDGYRKIFWTMRVRGC